MPWEELCGTVFLSFFFFDLGKTGHGFSEIQQGHGVVSNITLETNLREVSELVKIKGKRNESLFLT